MVSYRTLISLKAYYAEAILFVECQLCLSVKEFLSLIDSYRESRSTTNLSKKNILRSLDVFRHYLASTVVHY